MKKKYLLLFVVSLFSVLVRAQLARWIMRPAYDNIRMASSVPVIITDSVNTTSLWDFNGHRLAVTTDSVHPFREGKAVVTHRGSDVIKGFYRHTGEFIPLEGYSVGFSYPYFSSGYLLADADGEYCFIGDKGKRAAFGSFVKMFPFNEGFANCFTYESVDRLKNPYYGLLLSGKTQNGIKILPEAQ